MFFLSCKIVNLQKERKVCMSFEFRNKFGSNVFYNKYAHSKDDTWPKLVKRLVDDVCGTMGGTKQALLTAEEITAIEQMITAMKFIPGGRYLYYAGRQIHAFNNCALLKAEEDTREEWSRLTNRSMSCLMLGMGIGVDYSVLREKNAPLVRTGGKASGPLPLMNVMNEVGRNVMQGGSRRSAIYASLLHSHPDINDFLVAKNWHDVQVGKQTLAEIKWDNFNYPAPLDMTNISVNYDDAWLKNPMSDVFVANVRQALSTAEPGMSFNFGKNAKATLRNACCEVVSEDDSDVCNLGSINLDAVESLDEMRTVVHLSTLFLFCGTLRADLPYEKMSLVREKNRRIGLGLMGVHAWLLKRGYGYDVVPELHEWLAVYRDVSDAVSFATANRFSVSVPVANRAIAPTGSIGILAGTTTGIEPLFAVAFKRRYLTDGHRWKYEYVVDVTADNLIKEYGLVPSEVDTAYSLSSDYERRIKFQADVQDYVDMAISSTINLRPWGSESNNEDTVRPFAEVLARYAPRLRGFTCYPDGARGGQPLTEVDYEDAVKHQGVVFEENDICVIGGKGGTCGS